MPINRVDDQMEMARHLAEILDKIVDGQLQILEMNLAQDAPSFVEVQGLGQMRRMRGASSCIMTLTIRLAP